MSTLPLPSCGSLSVSRPAWSRAEQVQDISALVPGTGVRLPVVPGACELSAAERCEDCAGTGMWVVHGQLAACVCCPEIAEDVPAWSQPAEPIAPSTMYRAVPGGAVLVHAVGAGWATAAEILAVVFEHWQQLTGGRQPGGQSAAWLRKSAGPLFHPCHRWPLDTSAATTETRLRRHLAAGAIDPARVGLLAYLADLVAEAFGPTGLTLPPVAT